MNILNSPICVVVAAAAVLAGCGKQERLEAVGFAKVLSDREANFTEANAIEKDFIANAQAWCAGIVESGSGRGAVLDQNAAVAAELAKSAVAVSAQLSEVRQAIDAQPLHEEYTRTVRNAVTTQLTRRQRMLQDVRTLLESAATQFHAYRQSKSFTGDAYPDGIAQLNTLLASYKPPQPAVETALSSLKSKYHLRDNEI
jgi:hypothetical protein